MKFPGACASMIIILCNYMYRQWFQPQGEIKTSWKNVNASWTHTATNLHHLRTSLKGQTNSDRQLLACTHLITCQHFKPEQNTRPSWTQNLTSVELTLAIASTNHDIMLTRNKCLGAQTASQDANSPLLSEGDPGRYACEVRPSQD